MVVRMIVLTESGLYQLQNYKMKIKHVLFLLLLSTTISVLSSCMKTEQEPTIIVDPPSIQLVTFTAIGKDGKPLVQSKTDIISLTYINKISGKAVNVSSNVYQVPEESITEPLKKYNGIFIGSDLRQHAISGQSPGNEFEFAVNGKKIGTIYYECDLSPGANFKTKSFKFNGESIEADEFKEFPPIHVIKIK